MSPMEPSQRMLLTAIVLLLTITGSLAIRLCIGKQELSLLQAFGISLSINLVAMLGMWLGQVARPFQ